MDENKSGIMIVSIVAVVALFALTFMVLGETKQVMVPNNNVKFTESNTNNKMQDLSGDAAASINVYCCESTWGGRRCSGGLILESKIDSFIDQISSDKNIECVVGTHGESLRELDRYI